MSPNKNVPKEKILTYDCTFSFYNMRDCHKRLSRSELDGLVYNKVHVNVYLDGVSETFSFYIKQYHELIRYQMVISKEGDKLKVKVVDADYQFKKLLFESQLK